MCSAVPIIDIKFQYFSFGVTQNVGHESYDKYVYVYVPLIFGLSHTWPSPSLPVFTQTNYGLLVYLYVSLNV